MPDATALRLAIDLLHVPSQLHLARAEPLPDDVSSLLRVAAGNEEALNEAVQATERPPQVIREAAAFFIEEVLLAPDAGSYRTLGARPDATRQELRRNMGLLIKSLHPDLNGDAERTVFVGRVTGAWDDLKTPERRAAYDAARRETVGHGVRSCKQSLPRARSGGLRSKKRNANGVAYQGLVRPERTHNVGRVQRMGLWRRLLLLVLSGVRR